MRTKSQGNEVILSTYLHPNLIRTTPLLMEFCLSKFKTKINQVKSKHHLLQDTFTNLHETNNQIVPNLFNVYQLFATTGVTIIVALFLSLFNTMFLRLVFYITELHKIQVKSQLSFSKSPKQNEHQFYQIKSGITECLKNQVKLFLSKSQLCISDAQASQLTICSMLLQMSSDVPPALSCACLRLGPCSSCI